MLVAMLGLGFGLVQMINRPPDPTQALLALNTSDSLAGTTLTAASVGPGVQLAGPANLVTNGTLVEAKREIQASARVLEPNYTVESGDTLGRIAVRFNTTVERIQALNNLSDPRALRIGTRLVIPPAFAG